MVKKTTASVPAHLLYYFHVGNLDMNFEFPNEMTLQIQFARSALANHNDHFHAFFAEKPTLLHAC